jgi:F420-dependent oxidoreductase-like protein
MRYALMIEPQQGLSYREQLDIALLAERVGYEALFRSDHYLSFPGGTGLATTDAWTVLAGLARETSKIRLGALVSPVTFRRPGSFAKVVTTADEMSSGRIDVAVGTGWHELEHRTLGLPFPPFGERVDMLEDQLAVLRGLWDEPDGWSYEGHHVTIESKIFQPRPFQRPHPPVIVGGQGTPRSIRLAARYADEYNVYGSGPEVCRDAFARLDEECLRIERDPATIVRSVMVGLLIGADEAELAERIATLLAVVTEGDTDPRAWLDKHRPRWIMGTPDRARAMVATFEATGAQRIMLQDFLPRDHAMIELAAKELLARG